MFLVWPHNWKHSYSPSSVLAHVDVEMLLRNSFHWTSLKQDISNLKLLLTSGIGGITGSGKRFLILNERQHIKSTLFVIFWYCDHPYYGLLRENSRMCFRNISFNVNKMQLFGKAMTNCKWSAFERCAGWGCMGAALLRSHMQLWSTAKQGTWGTTLPSGGAKPQTLLSALTQAAWGSVSGSYQRVCPGGTSPCALRWPCHRILQQLLRAAASEGFLTHQGRGPGCAQSRHLL